ncbi:MAG: leucine-rich repeat domain-containing protein [Clostridiales Family XIII bacterium]|nr:leucine-rich repeat domain-containing protein [Clostridiales Family XIII bacterium]
MEVDLVLLFCSIVALGLRRKWRETKCAVVEIPDTVKVIGDGVFKHMAIESVKVPDSVKEIGREAFRGCDQLASITIPNSVKEIGHGLFKDCTALHSVVIPGSLEAISLGAFEGCENLTSVALPEYLFDSINRNGAFDDTPWLKNERQKRGLCVYCGGQLGFGLQVEKLRSRGLPTFRGAPIPICILFRLMTRNSRNRFEFGRKTGRFLTISQPVPPFEANRGAGYRTEWFLNLGVRTSAPRWRPGWCAPAPAQAPGASPFSRSPRFWRGG